MTVGRPTSITSLSSRNGGSCFSIRSRIFVARYSGSTSCSGALRTTRTWIAGESVASADNLLAESEPNNILHAQPSSLSQHQLSTRARAYRESNRDTAGQPPHLPSRTIPLEPTYLIPISYPLLKSGLHMPPLHRKHLLGCAYGLVLFEKPRVVSPMMTVGRLKCTQSAAQDRSAEGRPAGTQAGSSQGCCA